MAKCEMLHKNQKRQIPISTYALLAGATLVTMSLSNASLGKDFFIKWMSGLKWGCHDVANFENVHFQ